MEKKEIDQSNQNKEYNILIENVGIALKNSRQNIANTINTEIVLTYWQIGKYIIDYEQKGNEKAEYGSNMLNKLSSDLTQKYGKGFSRSNVFYIRKFYMEYPKVQTVSELLSWSHYVELLKIEQSEERSFYEIECKKFIQWLFYYQWMNLKDYAANKDIEIIGDMPIYVAYDSADVWANPGMFWLDENLNPVKVAGCPPDAFSPDGQLWGNPLYRWDLMKAENYTWWVERIKKSLELFDIVRIDHFRGFAGYFTIPFGDTTAHNGCWMAGPGYDLFRVVNEELPGAKIIAENLGFLDQSVHDLLDACGYPGMCIMEFDFGNGYDYSPLKDGLAENNVIYTGTHDNQTILSWYYELDDHLKWCVDEYFGITEEDKPNLKIIEGTFKTPPFMAIIPLQDYLGLLDHEGRMNIPSTMGLNWKWRLLPDQMKDEDAKLLYEMTKVYGRL